MAQLAEVGARCHPAFRIDSPVTVSSVYLANSSWTTPGGPDPYHGERAVTRGEQLHDTVLGEWNEKLSSIYVRLTIYAGWADYTTRFENAVQLRLVSCGSQIEHITRK